MACKKKCLRAYANSESPEQPSDQGLNCLLTESLNTTVCRNSEQRPGWLFANAQDDLNLHILCMFEVTFSLEVDHIFMPHQTSLGPKEESLYPLPPPPPPTPPVSPPLSHLISSCSSSFFVLINFIILEALFERCTVLREICRTNYIILFAFCMKARFSFK